MTDLEPPKDAQSSVSRLLSKIMESKSKSPENASDMVPLSSETTPLTEFHSYKRRWFYLFIICLAHVSVDINWLCFSPIADIAAQYYHVSYSAINWLALIFMIGFLVFVIPSTWVMGLVRIREHTTKLNGSFDTLGIRTGLLLGTWINAAGCLVRCLSTLPALDVHARYPIMCAGQSLCAISQAFILLLPTKFSSLWFSEKQRSLANALGLGSGFLGVIIGGVFSPLIVTDTHKMTLMLFLFASPALIASTLALFMRTSRPPTPPCQAVTQEQPQILTGIKELFQSKMYIILFICCGCPIGVSHAVATLMEQIMCSFGYDNTVTGLALGCCIGAGVVGMILVANLTDRTGQLDEISKVLYIAGSASIMLLVTLIICHASRYIIFVAYACLGFFTLPIYILSMELSLECVHPVPEATATGIILLSSQLAGICLILILPKLAQRPDAWMLATQKCSVSHQLVLDYTIPLFVIVTIVITVAILYVSTFKCEYKRRNQH